MRRSQYYLNKKVPTNPNYLARIFMNNKSAIVVVAFFGILLFTGLIMLQTCQGPPSSQLPGSFRIIIKAACPIAKDEQQFVSDIKILSTAFSAGSSSEKFFIPNVSLVRIDNLVPTSNDSASFDIASGLMHYFKTSLVEGTQFREMRADEEKSYFENPDRDSHFSDFRSKALRAHADEVQVIPNCSDNNEFFICHGICPDPPVCPDKYWSDVASLKKHLEKRFGTQPPSGEIVIYYLCGTGKPAKEDGQAKGQDTDGDSVIDEKDDCPTIAGKPVHLGCPDGDNDGVKDEWDRCPDVAGDAANNGCPKDTPPPPPPPIVIKAELSQDWQKNPSQPNNTIVVSIKNDALSEVNELRWRATPKPIANKQVYGKCEVIPGVKKSGIRATNEIVLSTADASCANCPYEVEIMAYDKNGNRIDKIKSEIVTVERIKCHSGK